MLLIILNTLSGRHIAGLWTLDWDCLINRWLNQGDWDRETERLFIHWDVAMCHETNLSGK